MRRDNLTYGLPKILVILTMTVSVVAGGRAAGQYRVLHTFAGGNDGMLPYAGVTLDPARQPVRNYGMGGNNGSGEGTVFKLTRGSGGHWSERVLFSFPGGVDGASVYSGVILDTAGNLYGTTAGGALGGTAFQLTPRSGGGWTENYLHKFGSGQDGAGPFRRPGA